MTVLVRYAFLCERATWQQISTTDHLSPLFKDRPALPGGAPYWERIARMKPAGERTLTLMEEIDGAAGGERSGCRRASARSWRRCASD